MFVQILGKSYNVNTGKLVLRHKGISELPESIGKLVNLTYLDLSVNQLTTIPESTGKLVNLTYLDLSVNQLTTIPKSIDKLVKLIKLFLNNNLLTTLPESIGKLVNLQYLYLDGNQLTTLPKSILNVKKSLYITKSAYEINNLSPDTKFLIFSWLDMELTNLPTGLKEIWIWNQHKNPSLDHKLPFGCEIKYF
jgi:internalin A